MLERWSHLLRGEVTLRVHCAFPERMLNLCAARGIALWDVTWKGKEEFACRLSRRDHRRLRRAVREMDCDLEVEGRAGVPFFLGRMRRRKILAWGLGLCAAGLLLGSFFVLDFEVQGNSIVTEEEILRSLSKNGVTLGTFGLSVDSEDVRNHVLLDIPELSWIAVNVSGFRAHVQVRERVEVPPIVDRTTPANIVAERDGLVIRIQALEGHQLVLPGTTVEKGQLLISGVEDLDTTGAMILAGTGKVWARTWRELTVEMPLETVQKVYTGKTKNRFALVLGTKRIKFYGKGGSEGEMCDKIIKRTTLTLPGDLKLPVTWVQETWKPYTCETVDVTPTQAEEAARALLLAQLSEELGEEGTISSAVCSSQEKDGRLRVTLKAECVEQIGRVEEIPTATEESTTGEASP